VLREMKKKAKKEKVPPSSYETMPYYFPTEQVDIVKKMKGKHLLVALVIAGTICGIVGYIGYTLYAPSEATCISFEEACSVFSQYFGGGRWEDFIALYGEDVEYSFKVYRQDDLAGYFLYRASNGTLFEADYESGEVGKALRQIIVPEDKEDYYVWEIIDLSPEYGGYKDKYIDARNGEILLGLPHGKRGPSPTPTPILIPSPPTRSQSISTWNQRTDLRGHIGIRHTNMSDLSCHEGAQGG